MPTYSDVNVIITRETSVVTKAGFGMPLILSTAGAASYKEYTNLGDVDTDFGAASEVYKIAEAMLSQSPRPEKIATYGIAYVSGTDPVSNLSDALNTLVTEHDDWYFLTCVEQGSTEIAELSGWADSHGKLYFVSTINQVEPASLNSDRTVIMFTSNAATEYPAEAWVGRCAPEDPGSITWKFKSLNGITPENISTTDLTTLHTNGGNTYIKKLGVNQTSEGIATSGEYIDIIRSQDWMTARLSEAVHMLLFNSKKVPYDNTGIAMVVNEVEAVMQRTTNQGIIAKDKDGNGIWTVSAPDVSEISTTDKGNRVLPDIYFECTLAGAVHEVNIKGVLQL